MRYAFDDCELDTDTVQFQVRGTPQAIEPQVFDVLETLLERRDRVVSKEELLDAVWHHRFVSESAITSRIKSARRVIGDDGRTQRLIRTVHGKGYQFVGDVRVTGADSADSAPSTPRPRISAVPSPPTRTIGRDPDIARVSALLDELRIVSLVGPGGVGKTRLALEVARRRVAERRHGEACFVDLTKVRDAALVTELVVRELGIHAPPDTDHVDVLEEALRDRSVLLVLDNYEHVLDAAGVVTALFQRCDQVTILVTSRARLRLAGEHVYDVEPLSIDDDAVALFAQVATAVDPSFDLASNRPDVLAMCRTVDGLPLAIELAAGHVRTLSPMLLRTRLGARLGSPAVAPRDAPARQQTITSTIDWSLQLLGEPERALFARLGVFSGAFPVDAVEQGCVFDDLHDPVESLTRLIDQSLVRRVAGAKGETRFVLLELLRERAREMLERRQEHELVADHHAVFIADYLEDLEERRWTEASDRWIDLINELLVEIRAAHAWAVQRGDRQVAARIAANLGTYWHREGHHAEGREWVADALSDVDVLDAPLVARLHLAAGFLEWPRDLLAARRYWEQAIEVFRSLGDDRYLAYALALVSGTYIGDSSSYDVAMGLCDEGIGLARRVGERPLIAQALNVKGELARVEGHDDVALVVYEEGRDLAGAAGDGAHLGAFLGNLSYLADHRGDYEEARRLNCEAVRLCWSLGRRMMVAFTLSELAGPELGLGRAARGALLVGASDEALRMLGVTRHVGDRCEHERVVEGLRGALGDEELARLRAEGALLSLDAAVAVALSDPRDPPAARPPTPQDPPRSRDEPRRRTSPPATTR